MNGFIIVALSGNSDKKYYVMNTSPLIWTSNINEAKIFEAYKYTKNELEDDFLSLSATISNSDIISVWILEYQNNQEIGRIRFI